MKYFFIVIVTCVLCGHAPYAASKNFFTTVFEEAYIVPYSNMGNLRLLLYDVPEKVEQTQWCFSARNKQRNPQCPTSEVVVLLQQGSIPTAEYIGAKTYPDYVRVKSDGLLNVTWTTGSAACLKIASPISGIWFAAAYLNEKKRDEAVTKLSAIDCSYLIQANVTSVAIDSISDIGLDAPITVTLQPGLYRARFPVSATTRSYSVYVNCSSQTNDSLLIPCPVLLSARGGGLPLNFSVDDGDQQVSLNCTEVTRCILNFSSPIVERQHYLNIVNIVNSTVTVWIAVKTSACPSTEICDDNDAECNNGNSPIVAHNTSVGLSTTETPFVLLNAEMSTGSMPENVVVVDGLNDTVIQSYVNAENTTASPTSKKSVSYKTCKDSVEIVMREEDPAVAFDSSGSLIYQFADTSLITSRFDVEQFKDTGGTLTVIAKLYQKNSANSVNMCIQSGSIPSSSSFRLACNSQTSMDRLTPSNYSVKKSFLYPAPGPWFITFQANCTNGVGRGVQRCGVAMLLSLEIAVSACLNTACQNGGQCRSYTRGIYSYTSCSCIAGYRGFTCEDDSVAASLQTQVMYTVFLTISNLAFIPAIFVACYRRYFFEAVVYLANMFFSSFYHWCDMTTWSKYAFCIAPYGSLQFCDFLCSLLSFWVTLMAIAKVHYQLRYVLFVVGLFALILPVHINRTGVIVNIVPIVVGVLTVLVSWVRICIIRKACYPNRRRWLFLVPGLALAILGICLFAFAETDANYPFTHSAWHVCMAFSIVFILPTSRRDVKEDSSSDVSSFELGEQSRSSVTTAQPGFGENGYATLTGCSVNEAYDDTRPLGQGHAMENEPSQRDIDNERDEPNGVLLNIGQLACVDEDRSAFCKNVDVSGLQRSKPDAEEFENETSENDLTNSLYRHRSLSALLS